MKNPGLIAFCGYPECGKSMLQNITEELWGYAPRDDARILRDAAKRLYGLSEDDVSTQDGKKRLIDADAMAPFSEEALRDAAKSLYALDRNAADDDVVIILDEEKRVGELIAELSEMIAERHAEKRGPVPVRRVLGELGLLLENRYGEYFVPDRTLASLDAAHPEGAPPSSFGSVRRGQAVPYKRRGGVVIEIRRPDRPTPKEIFDEYDRSLVDVVVLNVVDPEDLPGSAERLRAEAIRILTPILGEPRKRDGNGS
jgi:hypothetical protein